MKKLTIKKMSELRGISIDTLRYYDKIGLFKPAYRDPETNYRYYSIQQYEVLGTILELRHIGLSIGQIQQFMNNRNVEQSMDFLKEGLTMIENQIVELNTIYKTLSRRIENIEKFKKEYTKSNIIMRELSDRKFYSLNSKVDFQDIEAQSYGFLELEKKISNLIPLIANNHIGHIINKESLLSLHSPPHTIDEIELFIFLEDEQQSINAKTLPGGTYICAYYDGFNNDNRVNCIKELLDHCKVHNLPILSDAFHIMQVDISLTDKLEEASCEVQIRIA